MQSTKFWYFVALHWRKIGVGSLLFLFMHQAALAQMKNMAQHDKKIVHFGIALGFNFAHLDVNHSEAFIYHDSIKVVKSPRSPGFNVGIVSDLHLGVHSSLRFIPTLIFAEKDLEYTEIDLDGDVLRTKTIESIIMSFPLYYKYKSDRIKDNFRFYALAGGRFDWDLGSNAKARKAPDIVKLNNTDLLLEYGFGLEFYFPLFIFAPEIKFGNGISDIHVPTDNLRFSDVLGALRSKYITISLQFEG